MVAADKDLPTTEFQILGCMPASAPVLGNQSRTPLRAGPKKFWLKGRKTLMKPDVGDRQWSARTAEVIAWALRSRAMWFGSVSAMLWLSPDATLSAGGAVLHVILGWVEIGLKSLLEGLFGLSHRTAQVIFAWGGMGALLVALGIGAQRFWRLATERLAMLQTATLISVAVLQLAHLQTVVRAIILATTGLALALFAFA
jgi:hypothetical protein